MNNHFSKVIVCVSLAASIFAGTCSEEYGVKFEKIKRSLTAKRSIIDHNNMHIVTGLGLNAMGVAAIPAFFAYPVYAIAKLSYRNKLKFYDRLFDNNIKDYNNISLIEIIAELRDDGLDITSADIREELTLLNESRQLCDGSIFTTSIQSGKRMNRRSVPDQVPSKRKLINYLANKL